MIAVVLITSSVELLSTDPCSPPTPVPDRHHPRGTTNVKLSTVLPAAAALVAGYVLGTAAGRGRYREISVAATRTVSTAVHHPRVQQLLFDLAGQASSNASRIPGPAADLVDHAATHLQDTLTQPDHTPDGLTSGPGTGVLAGDEARP